MSSFSLQGRNAIVTGASRGIGRAIALRLADAGANVALTYRTREDDAHAVAREIEAKGRLAVALKMDLTGRASIEAAANEARGALGPLSLLVNNAGIAIAGDRDGPFICAQIFLPLLAETGHGAIVHIGSMSDVSAPDAASQAALISLAKVVAQLGAGQNVRSNAIAAGIIESDEADALSSAMESAVDNILLKRKGSPDEIADAVVFLASDASSYITAETLNVNGGLVQ